MNSIVLFKDPNTLVPMYVNPWLHTPMLWSWLFAAFSVGIFDL